MSVRQYIGARYVTKIYENTLDPSSAEWQAGVNYEPLTMVTYNNGSYLSKKDVPASVGNPADNPTYWVQTGFYNGQIASLQAQIDTINATMDINTPNLKDRKFILIGDSYGEGWDPDGTNDGWCKIFKDILSLDSDHCTYNGYGGSKFSTGGTMTYAQQITDYISVSDPEQITDIIIAGGFNDQVNTYAEIKDGADLVEAACASYTKARIHIAFIGWTSDRLNGSGGTYTQANLYQAYKAYEKVCLIKGWHFIPNAILWCARQNFSTDFKHPNQYGNTVIAENLILGLNGDNSVDIREQYDPITITMASGVTTANELYNINIQGNKLKFSCTYTHYYLSETVTMDEVNGVKLFEFDSPLIQTYIPIVIPVIGFIHTSSPNEYVNLGPCCLKFYNHECRFIAPLVTGGSYQTKTIDQIQFVGTNVELPFFNANDVSPYPITY